VTAFRPGGTTDVADDAGSTVEDVIGGGGGDDGGDGDGGKTLAGTAIVSGPGAASTTYATPVVIAQRGAALTFANLDAAQHDVTAVEKDSKGKPVFGTPLIGLGQTAPVEGTDRLTAGQTYDFFCSIHPGMRGQLLVR
jgi:plastocyanin